MMQNFVLSMCKQEAAHRLDKQYCIYKVIYIEIERFVQCMSSDLQCMTHCRKFK